MIRLNNVVKRYDNFCMECSLSVPTGQVTGLIGRNGAGKSTVFKSILGLIKPESGTIEVLGKNAARLTSKDKEQIGAVLADSGFNGYLTVSDLVPMLSAMYSSFSKEGFVAGCERMELPMDKKIKEFSTGMKRKLQILAALSHDARLLILDEPTAGLDVVARDELLDLLRGYMEDGERSIIISSHISSDLESFCDDIYLIDKGNIILHEETDTLLSQYGLIKATKGQFEALDKSYLIKFREEKFGFSCLTNQKQFYQDNYPELVVENGSIDEVIVMLAM